MRVAALLLSLPVFAFALGQPRYVDTAASSGSFAIVQAKNAAPIYVDSGDYPGVVRAAGDLAADVARVAGLTPAIAHDEKSLGTHAILAGALGHSALIDRLVREGKLDVAPIAGKWESFVFQVVSKPIPGVAAALVIAGSDKLGAIFGIYDLSEEIGVSPWYWWADVPVTHRDTLFVKTGTRYVQGPPAVKYRGIFLNDEAPALSGWVREKFGGYNHEFYTKVFELILRMKGNFLWPAMWGSAFNEDDPLNPKLADEYGIVMSTSHHEPMLRAQQEWKRHGNGPWDYSKNADVLRAFWTEGVERNKNYESIITLAMRGDGDMPMAGNINDNVALLEKIVADQRQVIADHMNPNVAAVPQVWALYKEVQGYYERGMRVPDDVTLLWSDDNWGNVRRLPTAEERKRSGGAGVYYHFDYVGGPRNYKWLNTVPITKVWEQMTQAYEYAADRIWIVNVGDLKPMEFPIEFWLHLAWNPHAWPKERIAEYTRLWAEREFGKTYALRIADIVSKYTKYNGRRKPELLDPTTWSLTNYREAERVSAEWKAISDEAESISGKLPQNARDAFFELVLYPVKASAQVVDLYIAAGRNHLYAEQGRASTNDSAAEVRRLFKADADFAAYYNHTMASGKWDHMMDQTHIGYTYWQEPRQNNMPVVKEIEVPAEASMGVDAESCTFDIFNKQRRYIDIYNKGRARFQFTASASAPWIEVSETNGTVEKEHRLWVNIDWNKAPAGKGSGSVKISGASAQPVEVPVQSFRPGEHVSGFVESDGYVAIEAAHFTNKVDTPVARWDRIDDYGRTLSSMAVFPCTTPSITAPANAPRLDYRMYLFDSGKAEVEAILAPTQNFVPGRGLRFAIAFDDQTPQVIDIVEHNALRDWEATVKDGVRKVKSTHTIAAPGLHTLKIWMVDPGIVLQKLVVDMGGVKPSYLGPPESFLATKNQ